MAAPGNRRRPRQARTRSTLIVAGGSLGLATWIVIASGAWGTSLRDASGNFRAADFVQFYVMGSLLLHGRAAELYDVKGHIDEGQKRIEAGLPLHAPAPNYGAQVAVAFVPFAAMPFNAALIVLTLLSAAAYAAGIAALCTELSRLRAEWPAVVVLAAGYPAFITTLRFGQLSTFTFLACALALVLSSRDRPFGAGVCLGVLFIKPPLLAVAVPVLVIAREWRILAGIATCAAGQILVALAAAGVQGLTEYVGVLVHLAQQPDLVIKRPENAHSIRGFARLLGAAPWHASLISLAATVAAVAAGASARHRSGSRVYGLAWVLLATVAVTPHLLIYDLLLLAAPSLVFGSISLERQGEALWRWWIPALVGLTYFAPWSGPAVAHYWNVQVSTIIIVALCIAAWLGSRRGVGRCEAQPPPHANREDTLRTTL